MGHKLKTRELEKAPRRLLAQRLGSRDYPTHRSPRPKPVAIATAGSRIVGADGGEGPKLAFPGMPRPRMRPSNKPSPATPATPANIAGEAAGAARGGDRS